MDAHKNLSKSSVATAPSPAASGTSLVVAAGEGARFPATPFNATVWPGGLADPSTAEIVRVTGRSTDTLTITRAQESTSARTIVVGDLIAASITAKTLDDVEIGSAATWFPLPMVGAIASGVPGANNSVFGQVNVTNRATITGVAYIVGSTANGNVKSALYDLSGAKVAEFTGTLGQGSANTWQKVPFDAPYAAQPGVYFVEVILSSATGTWFRAASVAPSGLALPGSFINPTSITPPTAPTTTMTVLTTY